MNSKKINKRINLVNLIPKEWNVKSLNNSQIKISYKTKGRGNDPKTFVLPKNLIINKNLIEATSMYLGDGKLSKDLHHLEFTSKDEDMIKFMLDFFKKRFNLKNKDFMFRKEAFQIGGIILRRLFGKIIENIFNSDFYYDKELRRAFLRGLFAAEGGIGIVQKENYITYMAYHLSFEKEESLANFVQKLLNLESITSKQIIRKNKGERYIQITNWQNYWKMYKMSVFDLNQRKKNKFLVHIKNKFFYLKITNKLKNKFLENTNKNRISIYLNRNPSCIFRIMKCNYFRFDNLVKLAKLNNLSLEEIKKNIIEIRTRNSFIIQDMDFVNFIFEMSKTWLP